MRFELHDKKKKSPVYFIIRRNRKEHRIFLKYPTGITLKPSEWNQSKQEVRKIDGVPHEDYNRTLKKIKDTATNIFDHSDFFALSGENIRQKIDIALKRTKSTNADNFYGYYNSFYENRKKQKGFERVKHFGTTLNKLKEFAPGLTWEKVDYDFYKRFVNWLEKKGFSKNYISKQIKNLKIVMSHAERENYHQNQTYRMFSAPGEQVYNVYLSESELKHLHEMKSLPKYLERARDLFLVGCFTGMRAENYLSIDPEVNVNLETGTITTIVNKGGGRVKIPIHWIVREIIEKYNGLPESISQQKLNKYVKDICRAAKFTEKVITVKTLGGKRTEIVKEKWEMVTTHTARRSLATNLYLRNAPLKYIMSITGHKTEAQCISYIKAGMDEFYEKVKEMDFWEK